MMMCHHNSYVEIFAMTLKILLDLGAFRTDMLSCGLFELDDILDYGNVLVFVWIF